MEVLSNPIVAVVLLLGVLVVVHEAGHFIVGRLCGIAVETFSVGFGPRILHYTKNKTTYCLSIIPLGGFVKFYGALPSEEVPEHVDGISFHHASPIKKFATIAAGPIFNFLLAIAIFMALGMSGLRQPAPIVGELLPDSPAIRSGLQFNDIVVEVSGEPVKTWKDLQRLISAEGGSQISMKVKRDDKLVDITITPDLVKEDDLPGSKGRIGISPSMLPSIITVLSGDSILAKQGAKTGDRIVSLTYAGEKHEIKYWREFTNYLSTKSIVGPVRLELKAYDITSDKLSEQSKFVDLKLPSDVDSLFISDSQLTISHYRESKSGQLLKGDKLLTWNNESIENAFVLSNIIQKQFEKTALVKVLRNSQEIELKLNLDPVEIQKPEGRVVIYTLPIVFLGSMEPGVWMIEKYSNPFEAFLFGVRETWQVTKVIATAVKGLFTGDMPLKSLGGPIAIAKVASDSVKMGLQTFFTAMAMISINLGLLNFIPIPVLDGGQLVLALIEGIIRRPISEQILENYQKVGFIMVMALVVMATYNDLGRFWANIVGGL